MDSNKQLLFNVLTVTASELQERLAASTLTSLQIATGYLSQIEKHNDSGMRLNAMITIAPEELVYRRARELDRERKEGRVKGPLHGIPIIVKVGIEDSQGLICRY